MTKTLLVAGYGPGISHAVAKRFAKAGFSVALLARDSAKLARATSAFEAEGVKAVGIPVDLSNPAATREAVRACRSALGPITVLHWNAAVPVAGDLVTAPAEELTQALNGGVASLLAAVQETLPDLRNRAESAVLVTNGGFGVFVDAVDVVAVQTRSMGLSVANAAKHKLVRVLAQRLKTEGVFVGEVMVKGIVKGTAWDKGNATLEPDAVASRFWQLYEAKGEHLAAIGP